MAESQPRRFASLTRTPTPQGFTVLDAIDTDGRAWWLVLGDDAAPDDWTELEPLPDVEVEDPDPFREKLAQAVEAQLWIQRRPGGLIP